MSIRFEMKDWADSFYCFENGDGSCYSVHLCDHNYGGILVMCNDSSMWLYYSAKYSGGRTGEHEIKHLCGDDNKYTKKAMLQIMKRHCDKFGM